MKPSDVQRLRDHELVYQLYKNSQRLVDLLEFAGNQVGADEVDAYNKAFARENVLDRILERPATKK